MSNAYGFASEPVNPNAFCRVPLISNDQSKESELLEHLNCQHRQQGNQQPRRMARETRHTTGSSIIPNGSRRQAKPKYSLPGMGE